jgi:hypothetical protein
LKWAQIPSRIWEVTHVSQSQDLDWIFKDVLDDLFPNTGVGLGDLEATRAGVLNPEFDDPHRVPELPNNMSAVRTQGLVVNGK